MRHFEKGGVIASDDRCQAHLCSPLPLLEGVELFSAGALSSTWLAIMRTVTAGQHVTFKFCSHKDVKCVARHASCVCVNELANAINPVLIISTDSVNHDLLVLLTRISYE